MAKTKVTKQTSKASTKQAKASAKRPAKSKTPGPGDVEVTVCRRRSDRRQSPPDEAPELIEVEESGNEPDAVVLPPQRPKVQRRRQIDPTTCERDYTGDEIEFMHALDAYKRSSGRMFPTCSEILEVVRGLGYIRVGDSEDVTAEAAAMEAEAAELVEIGADQTS